MRMAQVGKDDGSSLCLAHVQAVEDRLSVTSWCFCENGRLLITWLRFSEIQLTQTRPEILRNGLDGSGGVLISNQSSLVNRQLDSSYA